MKKILTTFALIVAIQSYAQEPTQGSYCLGVQTGYIDSYCYLRRPCKIKDPIVCVKPKNIKATYYDGYEYGYKKGEL